MGLLSGIKKFFSNVDDYNKDVKEVAPEPNVIKPQRLRKPRAKKEKKPVEPVVVKEVTQEVIDRNQNSKAMATAAKSPWVNVLGIELDLDHIGTGNFELDWNDYFVKELRELGYQGKTDAEVVDQWFVDLCKNVVLETYEQHQADPSNRTQSSRRPLDDGRTEVS